MACHIAQMEERSEKWTDWEEAVLTLTSLEVLMVGRTRMVREGMLVTSTVMSHVPSSSFSSRLMAICLTEEEGGRDGGRER